MLGTCGRAEILEELAAHLDEELAAAEVEGLCRPAPPSLSAMKFLFLRSPPESSHLPALASETEIAWGGR